MRHALGRLVMKQILFVIFCLSAGCSDSRSRDPNRHYEQNGGYSFVPPPGWRTAELPGFKYKVVAGEAADGFAPNINVVEEKYTGSLESYIDLNEASLERFFEDFERVSSKQEFVTDSGLTGFKLVCRSTQLKKRLQQTFYFFDGGSRKFVVTCSRLADAADGVDALHEGSLRSFRFED
jgi:hypothetical protein